MKNQTRFFLPAIGWLIFSTVLLTLPASAFPREKWYTNIPMFDKWVHIGMFSIMAVLLCWGIYKKNKPSEKLKYDFVTIGILCLVYGVAIEFIQRYFIPNRSFDMGDIIADGAGVVAGVVYSFKRYIKK